MTGPGIKSLWGAFNGKSDENYRRIVEGSSKGLYTGNIQTDLAEIKIQDRAKISYGIRCWLKNRNLSHQRTSNNFNAINDHDAIKYKKSGGFHSLERRKINKVTESNTNSLKKNIKDSALSNMLKKVSMECDKYSNELKRNKESKE